MNKKSLLSLIFTLALTSVVNAQTASSTKEALKEVTKAKILNPAEHNPASGTHYGQTLYGDSKVAQPAGNNSVGGQGGAPVGGMGNQLPSGREVSVQQSQSQANTVASPPKSPENLNASIQSGQMPVYERVNLFNSYLKGIVENVTPMHISAKLLTSALDLPQGDLMVNVAKRDENNIRAFALVVRLSDGSYTSLFQADRGENFKVGNLVQAPIILNKESFIIGTFKKMQ